MHFTNINELLNKLNKGTIQATTPNDYLNTDILLKTPKNANVIVV